MRALLVAAAAAQAAAANAGKTWEIISADVGTISTGAAFVTGEHGYLPVVANGVGPAILHTRNGGKSWTQANSEPFALLLLDIAAYSEYVAVVGALTMEYSLDNGTSFNSSLAQPGAGQCIRAVGPKGQEIGFAAVGEWGLFTDNNGVEVSYDAGITYQSINISDMVASARYGAFTDDKTWFIAAGDWPGEGADDDATDDNALDDNPPADSEGLSFSARGPQGRRYGHPQAGPKAGAVVDPAHYQGAVPSGTTVLKAQSASYHLLKSPAGVTFWARVLPQHKLAANTAGRPLPPRVSASLSTGVGNSSSTWEAQVAKTTDGGKTWSVVLSKFGQFYFNGIECTSTQQCCVVAESGAGTTGGGTFIFCTSDGGNTWSETLVDEDPDSSLSDVAAYGPQEFWAVGGEFGAIIGPLIPHFYHTTDGGKSWALVNSTNETQLLLQDAIAVDCVPGANCWANLLDIATQESSVAALNA